MKPVGSLTVQLEPDGDGWMALDTETGEIIRCATWAEVLWECQVRRARKRSSRA